MNLNEQIEIIVEQAVIKALHTFKTSQEDKGPIIFISPRKAGDMIGVSDDIIKAMQDAGQLSLCFKPSPLKDGKEANQGRHRLVLLSEILEIQKKMIARPAKKKK